GVDYSPLKRYDETVTINVIGIEYDAIGDVPKTYNGKASGPRNNAFNDAALQYLNIKLNYVSTTSGENYETRLNTLIAANDVPDIFITSSDTTFENLRRTGLIADIAPTFWYLNDKMQEFYLDEMYYPAIETCMQGGKLYAFPNVDNPNEAAQKIYIRKDWLDIVGKEIPSTYEALIDVARSFKEHATDIAATETGISAGEIVPIGITREIATKGNNTAQGFFNLFGAQPNWYFEKDGTVIDSNTSGEMKRALEELHKLYDEGLIDKEFYTDTDASVSNDIVAGKVGIVSGMWHAATYPLQSSVSNEYTPGAEWISIELPSVGGVKVAPVVDAMRMQNYTMVSSKCAHPEALAKLVNLFYDMFYSNTAQETYGSLATPEGGFFYSWVPAKVWYTPYSLQSYYRINEVFEELWQAGFRINGETLTQMAD
ncbi:MAG: extracellular solute-binding protein, partial [Clostridiales bacterium]|nr:extracellular solute-binding protein [Clostridiales bacterium]